MEQLGTAQAVTTDHPRVDDVLRSLDALSELPVEQHVEVFEAAHVALRDALSSPQTNVPTGAQG